MLHNTLNAALIAGNVALEYWPISCNIGYNQNARVCHNGLFITVTRFDNGLYETAISYETLCDDGWQVYDNK